MSNCFRQHLFAKGFGIQSLRSSSSGSSSMRFLGRPIARCMPSSSNLERMLHSLRSNMRISRSMLASRPYLRRRATSSFVHLLPATIYSLRRGGDLRPTNAPSITYHTLPARLLLTRLSRLPKNYLLTFAKRPLGSRLSNFLLGAPVAVVERFGSYFASFVRRMSLLCRN